MTYAPTGSTPSQFNLPAVNWNNTYNEGYLIDLALGSVILSTWRLEGEYLSQEMIRNINGSYDWNEMNVLSGDTFAPQTGNQISNSKVTANFYSLLLNFIRDFKTNSKFTPFVGFGAGFMWAKSSSTTVHDTLQVNDLTAATSQATVMRETSPAYSGASYAWQFKAGLTFDITENFSLVAQYRLFGTSKITATSSSMKNNPDSANEGFFQIPSKTVRGLLNNAVDLNLRYSF